MKDSMKVLISVLIGLIILIGSIYAVGYLKRMTADFRGETSQIEKTKADGSYRISSYENFYDTCASVQSLETKIMNMEDELELADSEQRSIVLNASITASKNKRAQLITKYNADARKEATQGQFKASDLPYQLDVKQEETVCEVY